MVATNDCKDCSWQHQTVADELQSDGQPPVAGNKKSATIKKCLSLIHLFIESAWPTRGRSQTSVSHFNQLQGSAGRWYHRAQLPFILGLERWTLRLILIHDLSTIDVLMKWIFFCMTNSINAMIYNCMQRKEQSQMSVTRRTITNICNKMNNYKSMRQEKQIKVPVTRRGITITCKMKNNYKYL